jgi:hypothetical protein
MTRQGRSDRASFLAAVAVLGLVAGPLLHAEQHASEEHEEEAEALAEAWRAGSTDPLEKLAFALEHAHGTHHPRPPAQHHSHGPAGGSPHGAGALAHLSLALHAAPALPKVALGPPHHTPPEALVAQLPGTLPWLVPEWSQGPPIVC